MIADNTLRSISYMIPEQENSQKRKKLKETNLKKKKQQNKEKEIWGNKKNIECKKSGETIKIKKKKKKFLTFSFCSV